MIHRAHEHRNQHHHERDPQEQAVFHVGQVRAHGAKDRHQKQRFQQQKPAHDGVAQEQAKIENVAQAADQGGVGEDGRVGQHAYRPGKNVGAHQGKPEIPEQAEARLDQRQQRQRHDDNDEQVGSHA